MTTTDTTTSDTDEVDVVDTTGDQGVDDDAGNGDASPSSDSNAEAAKWRRKLRDAEAERDALAERLAAHDRAAVEAAVADRMIRPADLWLTGVEVADLLDDDGNVDAEKLTECLDGLLEERPHWAAPRPMPSHRPIPKGGTDPTTSRSEGSWAEVIASAE